MNRMILWHRVLNEGRSRFKQSYRIGLLSLVSLITLQGLVNVHPIFLQCSNADELTLAMKHSQDISEDSVKREKEGTNAATIYGFKATSLEGTEIDFNTYKGDVLLIVNTASDCGFTPQYKGLQKLHKKFEERGLKVLGFPCNQFGHQEPGDSKTIANFCQKNYGVTFQMFEKIDVNGENAHPLYKFLTGSAPGFLGSKAIKWNFTKFLVDRQGHVVKRFGPNFAPEDIAAAIEKLL